MSATLLKETGGAEAIRPDARGNKVKREITIIQEGWGSSGYYGMDVLERDIPRIYPVGTHMYMNHPTRTEEAERPERDVKDLAAVLTSTPRKSGISMVAEAEIFEHWEPAVTALAENIGTSIVANGIAEQGSAGGKDGPVIKALTEGLSVDFVTKAGAGGKIGPLIESAHAKSVELKESMEDIKIEEARNVAHWIEGGIHQDFTMRTDSMFRDGRLTREERIALSTAIGEALTSFNTSVEANAPDLLDRDPFAEAPTGTVSVEEKKELEESSTNKEARMGQDEQKLSELQESVSKLQEADRKKDEEIKDLKESAKKDKDRADRAEEALLAKEAGRLVAESLKDNEGLTDSAKKRVCETVLRKELPVHSDGKLDSGLLKERTLEAAKAEAAYIAELTGGETSVTEASKVTPAGGSAPSAEKSEEALVEAFKGMGMSDDAAKIAAKGR